MGRRVKAPGLHAIPQTVREWYFGQASPLSQSVVTPKPETVDQ